MRRSSTELKRFERAQTPKITNIDHLLNMSPPISFKYISPDTKNPLVKNPNAMNPKALVSYVIGYKPIASTEANRTPRALVLRDK